MVEGTEEKRGKKDSRRSLLAGGEEGRHVARLCFRGRGGRSSGISLGSARTLPSFLLISLLLGRFRSNVSLRSHADNFLSFGGDKETLTRTGSLIYHLVQPVSKVRRPTKGTIFNFVSSKLSLKATLRLRKKARARKKFDVEQYPPLKRFFITYT